MRLSRSIMRRYASGRPAFHGLFSIQAPCFRPFRRWLRLSEQIYGGDGAAAGLFINLLTLYARAGNLGRFSPSPQQLIKALSFLDFAASEKSHRFCLIDTFEVEDVDFPFLLLPSFRTSATIHSFSPRRRPTQSGGAAAAAASTEASSLGRSKERRPAIREAARRSDALPLPRTHPAASWRSSLEMDVLMARGGRENPSLCVRRSLAIARLLLTPIPTTNDLAAAAVRQPLFGTARLSVVDPSSHFCFPT